MKRIKGVMKARNMWDDPCVFSSNVGNGLAVPQWELNKKGQMVKKLDNDGKQITKNKYLDIQEFRHVNDYKTILEKNGGDVSVFNENVPPAKDVDTTKLGTIEQVLNAGAKLKALGMNLDDALKAFDKIVAEFNAERGKTGEIKKDVLLEKKEQEKEKQDDKEKK